MSTDLRIKPWIGIELRYRQIIIHVYRLMKSDNLIRPGLSSTTCSVKPRNKQVRTGSHLFRKSGSWSSKYLGNQAPFFKDQESFSTNSKKLNKLTRITITMSASDPILRRQMLSSCCASNFTKAKHRGYS